MTEPAHVILRVRCAHCNGAIELECENLRGFYGYNTYNAYFCPHCRKQHHQLCSGPIVATRVPMDDDVETAATKRSDVR